MAEQGEPVEAQEATPDTGTPELTAAEELYQKRYNDLRPEYDRVQNELNKYTDPEQRRQVFTEWAGEFGYTLDEGEQQFEEYDDPNEALRAELDSLKSEWQNYTAQQQQQMAINIAESYSENKLDALGIENEKQREWIVSRASAMPALEHEGFIVPDVEAAYHDYQELVAFEQSTWAQSKQGIPHTPTGGVENTGVPALSDDPHERAIQRQRIALEKYQALGG